MNALGLIADRNEVASWRNSIQPILRFVNEARKVANIRRNPQRRNVRFGSEADICSAQAHVRFTPNSDRESGPPQSHVRFTPESGHVRCTSLCLLWANTGHRVTHSITSLARASSDGGTVRPSALAASRLMTNSNLVDCCTGRSAGFSRLRSVRCRCRPGDMSPQSPFRSS